MISKAEIKDALTELLHDKADFALLFGSWAKDVSRVTPDSDVDCGVFFKENITDEELYFDLPEQFQAHTGRKLDIICLNTADMIIANQVVTTGEEVFVHSKTQLTSYKAQVVSQYIDFKQSRKVIEDNILQRPNYGQR